MPRLDAIDRKFVRRGAFWPQVSQIVAVRFDTITSNHLWKIDMIRVEVRDRFDREASNALSSPRCTGSLSLPVPRCVGLLRTD